MRLRDFALACVVVSSAWAVPVSAQQARSAAQRSADVAAERAALALLDDPDSLTRQNAMKDIMASGDPLLRDAAIRKVAASTDSQMKAAALRMIFARPNKLYIFNIEGCGGLAGSNQASVDGACHNFASGTSGSFSVSIKNVDESDGSLSFYSPKGSARDNGRPVAYFGKITGSKIRFNLNLVYFNTPQPDCAGTLELQKDASLKGQVQCGWMFVNGSLDVN